MIRIAQLTESQKKKRLEVEAQNWSGIYPKSELLMDPRKKLELRLREFKGILKSLDSLMDLKQGTWVDLDCGFGYFEMVCSDRSIRLIGIEPDAKVISADGELLSLQPNVDLVQSHGEALPFADSSVDGIVSFSVLEHVVSPEKVLSECFRILKPGGRVFIGTPNYKHFRESHYKIFFVPSLPRSITKLYLRLLGKNPDFLDSLHYLTPHQMKNLLQNQGFEITRDAVDWGLKRLDERLASTAESGVRKILFSLIRWLRLRGLCRLMIQQGYFISNAFLVAKPRGAAGVMP